MAKLSAHGYEVARMETSESYGTDTEYRTIYSFRSDGYVLRRLVALNIHANGSPHHDYGWKLYRRLKNRGAGVAEQVAGYASVKRDRARNMGVLVSYK